MWISRSDEFSPKALNYLWRRCIVKFQSPRMWTPTWKDWSKLWVQCPSTLWRLFSGMVDFSQTMRRVQSIPLGECLSLVFATRNPVPSVQKLVSTVLCPPRASGAPFVILELALSQPVKPAKRSAAHVRKHLITQKPSRMTKRTKKRTRRQTMTRTTLRTLTISMWRTLLRNQSRRNQKPTLIFELKFRLTNRRPQWSDPSSHLQWRPPQFHPRKPLSSRSYLVPETLIRQQNHFPWLFTLLAPVNPTIVRLFVRARCLRCAQLHKLDILPKCYLPTYWHLLNFENFSY